MCFLLKLMLNVIYKIKKSMIEKIEELRKDLGLRKRDLCVSAGVSVTMYSRYLGGTVMGVDVCERMLGAMGFRLEVVSKD